jgi:hypothetical protein
MKNLKGIDSFTLEELKKMQEFISSYDSFERLKRDLSIQIEVMNDNRKNINERFDLALMQRLQIVDSFQLKVLQNNSIHNIQELIDCDLDSLVGITPSMKMEFEWIKRMYDLRTMVDIPKQKKIGEK